MVLPQLAHIADDPDVCVRIRAVQMLVDIVLASESVKCLEILKLIDKVSDCCTISNICINDN